MLKNVQKEQQFLESKILMMMNMVKVHPNEDG